jgi:hypothetical protein
VPLVLLFVLSPVFAALLLLPGYLAARLLVSRDTPVELFWCWAACLGTSVVAVVQFVSFAAFGSVPAATAAVYIALVAALGGAARRMPPPDAPWNQLFIPLIGYGAFVLFCAGITALVPSYRTAYMGDWALYYPNAFAYLREVGLDHFREGIRMEYLVRRTPFFSLCCSFFAGFTGLRYASFQMASTVVNSLLFWGILAVGHACGGARVRRCTLFVLPLLPMIIGRISMPTPKPLAAMLIFATILAQFHGRRNAGCRSVILTASLAATAYMTHPMALFYLVLPGLIWLRDRLREKQAGPSLAIGTAAASVLILPWFAWAIGELGIQRVLVPSYTISETRLPVWQYFLTRISIVLTCIVPYPLLHVLRRFCVDALSPQLRWHAIGTAVLRMYYDTIPAGLGLFAAAYGLGRCARGGLPTISREGRQLWCFALAGSGLCLIAHIIPDHKGLAFTVFTPLVILSVSLLAACLQHAPRALWLAFGAEALLVRVLVVRLGLQLPVSRPYITVFHELDIPVRMALLMATAVALAVYYRHAVLLQRGFVPAAGQ